MNKLLPNHSLVHHHRGLALNQSTDIQFVNLFCSDRLNIQGNIMSQCRVPSLYATTLQPLHVRSISPVDLPITISPTLKKSVVRVTYDLILKYAHTISNMLSYDIWDKKQRWWSWIAHFICPACDVLRSECHVSHVPSLDRLDGRWLDTSGSWTRKPVIAR
jgi:hypothetical protein